MQKVKAQPCKTKYCANLAVGFKRCEVCRERNRASAARYRVRHREKYRERQRGYTARYVSSGSRKAKAYLARHKPQRVAACLAWMARHPARKRLINDLNNLVARGDITKPSRCDDCRRAARPVVAWGLHRTEDGLPEVSGWCCWSCWWRRRREGSK